MFAVIVRTKVDALQVGSNELQRDKRGAASADDGPSLKIGGHFFDGETATYLFVPLQQLFNQAAWSIAGAFSPEFSDSRSPRPRRRKHEQSAPISPVPSSGSNRSARQAPPSDHLFRSGRIGWKCRNTTFSGGALSPSAAKLSTRVARGSNAPERWPVGLRYRKPNSSAITGFTRHLHRRTIRNAYLLEVHNPFCNDGNADGGTVFRYA